MPIYRLLLFLLLLILVSDRFMYTSINSTDPEINDYVNFQ